MAMLRSMRGGHAERHAVVQLGVVAVIGGPVGVASFVTPVLGFPVVVVAVPLIALFLAPLLEIRKVDA